MHIARPPAARHQRVPAVGTLAPGSLNPFDVERTAIGTRAAPQSLELFGAELTAHTHRKFDRQLRELAHERLRQFAITREELEPPVIGRQGTDRHPASASALRQLVKELTGGARFPRGERLLWRAVIHDDARG